MTHDKEAIRVLNTSPEDLEACNVEHLVRVFRDVSNVPKHAKALRGLVVLGVKLDRQAEGVRDRGQTFKIHLRKTSGTFFYVHCSGEAFKDGIMDKQIQGQYQK